MAVEVGLSPDDDSPKTRFVRYLFVGKEYPVYHAGTWTNQNYFTMDKIPSVEELAADKETELYPITEIKKAIDSKLVQKPEILMFALAACARQQKSEKLRQAAYTFLAEQCKDTEHFMLFISFASQLSKQHLIPKHGYGHGWRSAVNKWYTSKSALSLAECVTKFKSRHGWKHKDIIKLSHPVVRGLETDIQAIFKYVMYGLEKTKVEFENDPKARDVVDFIERVERFRQCEDAIRTAGLIRTCRYTLEHVHSSLMRSPEVWEAIVETMDFPTLILNLQKMQKLGLLTTTSQVTEKVISAITNKEQVLKSKVQPAYLLMALKNYENPERVPAPVKRRMTRKHKLRNRPLPHPDKRIIEALYSALNTSFSSVEPTGLRYLITTSTVGCVKENGTAQTQQIGDRKPWVLEAACIILLSLLRAEEKVTVAAFCADEGLNARIIHIDKNANFHEAMDRMKSITTVPPHLGTPILWAAHCRKKYDVFINIVDKMRGKYDFITRAMDLYKKKMNLPNTRLVNWVVGSTFTHMAGKNVNDVLTVCGFDVHVSRVIEAFSKRQF